MLCVYVWIIMSLWAIFSICYPYLFIIFNVHCTLKLNTNVYLNTCIIKQNLIEVLSWTQVSWIYFIICCKQIIVLMCGLHCIWVLFIQILNKEKHWNIEKGHIFEKCGISISKKKSYIYQSWINLFSLLCSYDFLFVLSLFRLFLFLQCSVIQQ